MMQLHSHMHSQDCKPTLCKILLQCECFNALKVLCGALLAAAACTAAPPDSGETETLRVCFAPPAGIRHLPCRPTLPLIREHSMPLFYHY